MYDCTRTVSDGVDSICSHLAAFALLGPATKALMSLVLYACGCVIPFVSFVPAFGPCYHFYVEKTCDFCGDVWMFIRLLTERKIRKGFGVLFLKGVGCNWLVRIVWGDGSTSH